MKIRLEGFMKTVKKTLSVFAILLLIVLLNTCSSTGSYFPLSNNETIIGTVQITFSFPATIFVFKNTQDAVNKQSYVRLMEVAAQKYQGNIDVKDIVWATGDTIAYTNTEIFATGKVVQVD